MGRAAIRTAVAEVLTAHFAAYTPDGDDPDLSAVTVHRQSGGDEQGAWSITLGQIPPSPRTVRAMRGPGHIIPNTSTFPIPMLIEVREQTSAEAGDDLVESIVAQIDEALLIPPHEGLPRAQYAPGELTGPNPYRAETGGAFLISQAVYTLEVTLQS